MIFIGTKNLIPMNMRAELKNRSREHPQKERIMLVSIKEKHTTSFIKNKKDRGWNKRIGIKKARGQRLKQEATARVTVVDLKLLGINA